MFVSQKNRDVPDFGTVSGRSGILPFLANPTKSRSGQIFDHFGQIWQIQYVNCLQLKVVKL